MSRGGFLIVLFFAWLSCATFPAAASPKASRGAVALNALPDPGPRPVLDSSDYDAYRRVGTSQIVGHISIAGAEGKDEVCRGFDVMLYPNTPFTRWAIARWARNLDGERFVVGALFPGDTATNLSVPNYLDPSDFAERSTSAIHFGRCNFSNDVVFTHVPAGKYIFVTETMREVVEARERTGQVIVNTPYGEHPENYDGGSYVGGHFGDGFVVASRLELTVEDGQTYTLVADNLRSIAHFAP